MLVRSLAAAFAVLLSAGLAAPASAAPTLSPLAAAQLQALLKEADLGLGAAHQRVAEEAGAAELAATLAEGLGSSFAGAWFEAGTTDLVVAITDPAQSQQVRDAGAIPRLVPLDLLTLNGVMEVLDSRA
ncbi:MAG TPA: hypothetical protein VHH34_04805, partial [Pseudonocardiaceae bacterium]|nr:hypothetical protein [Pseudonocardiaceae bacterium]